MATVTAVQADVITVVTDRSQLCWLADLNSADSKIQPDFDNCNGYPCNPSVVFVDYRADLLSPVPSRLRPLLQIAFVNTL